jgi:hypothetical protein
MARLPKKDVQGKRDKYVGHGLQYVSHIACSGAARVFSPEPELIYCFGRICPMRFEKSSHHDDLL